MGLHHNIQYQQRDGIKGGSQGAGHDGVYLQSPDWGGEGGRSPSSRPVSASEAKPTCVLKD